MCLPFLYDNVLLVDCAKVNMLRWKNYPTNLVGGYPEGSKEIMLALYKLNEVLFDANVVYPFKIYNQGGDYCFGFLELWFVLFLC